MRFPQLSFHLQQPGPLNSAKNLCLAFKPVIITVLSASLALSSSFSCAENSASPLHPTIQKRIKSQSCNKIERCGDMVSVDCNSALDGPLTYYDNTNGKILMRCGGVCMHPPGFENDPLACKQCPLKAWTQCKNSQKSKAKDKKMSVQKSQ